ncbi:MAG: IS66 family transposase [Planctomycetes bacterium]|nr:IS66 family transposase [Planctomycetota bacterium]
MPPSSNDPEIPYEELKARYERAQKRILELERILMRQDAQSRADAVRRELLQGQPLLDLAAGQEPVQGQPEGGEEEEGGDAEEEPEPADGSKKRRKGGRRKFPAHLRREVKEYSVDPERDLPDYDPSKGYKIIDYDNCEELHLPRPEPWVMEHKRPVVLYTTTEGETRLVTVGGMSKVFPKCAASPDVLARIAVDRLHYHLTLYRIERFFAEHDCPLARSTLCMWMIWLGRLLDPIAKAQEREIEKVFKRHADDTEVRVLAPGKCDRVRVWVVIGEVEGGKEYVFRFTEERTAVTVAQVLGAHVGYLQVDACGAYDGLYKNGKLIEVGCWSHVFRKFEEVLTVDSRAGPMMRMIRKLYDVEDVGETLKPEERKIFRRLASLPILERIRRLVMEQREAEFLESSFKKALNYVNNQWTALNRFLEDGRLSLDNNIAEAEFHVLGVGRRNYLFWGSREGLKSGLVLYGLIRSCVANGINPYVYLEDVIRRVATTETPAHKLMPSRWKDLPPLPAQNRLQPVAAVTG